MHDQRMLLTLLLLILIYSYDYDKDYEYDCENIHGHHLAKLATSSIRVNMTELLSIVPHASQ